MVNGKMPLLLTAVGLAGLAALALVWQPYSADGNVYAKPARRYIHAAVRQDSASLARLSASAEPVRWGLDASRAHAASLRVWDRRFQAWTGRQLGDTTEVFLYPDGDECGDAPIVLHFVGSGGDARVLRASSNCWRH
jgi:hypothetical protein